VVNGNRRPVRGVVPQRAVVWAQYVGPDADFN